MQPQAAERSSWTVPARTRLGGHPDSPERAAARPAEPRLQTPRPEAAMVLRRVGDEARASPVAAGPAASAGPAAADRACPGHERGEVARSKTAAGHLSPDVREEAAGALVVADFGVGEHRLKGSTVVERPFQRWRSRFEANTAYRLKIFGFSDCVGSRELNVGLRYRRAQAVHDAMLPSTQTRVVQKGPFDPQLFLVDNRTPETRAVNRGVLVAFEQQHEGEVIEGEGDLVEQVVEQSLRSLSPSPYDQEFLRCWIEGVTTPGFDRLYVNGFSWALHTQELEPPSAYTTLLRRRSRSELESLGIVVDLRKELVREVVPGEDTTTTSRRLRGIASRYDKGVAVAAKIAGKYSIGGGSAVNPGDRQLIDHIAASTDRPSIHRCYLDFYAGG